jgi:hypothetical protein
VTKRVTFTFIDYMAHGLHLMTRLAVRKDVIPWRQLKASERQQLRKNIQMMYRDWRQSQRVKKWPVLKWRGKRLRVRPAGMLQ